MARKKWTWGEVLSALRQLGCDMARSSGNHQVWTTPGGRTFPVWVSDVDRRPSRDYLSRIEDTLKRDSLSLWNVLGEEDQHEEESEVSELPKEAAKSDVVKAVWLKPKLVVKRKRIVIEDEFSEASFTSWQLIEALKELGYAVPDEALSTLSVEFDSKSKDTVVRWTVQRESEEDLPTRES